MKKISIKQKSIMNLKVNKLPLEKIAHLRGGKKTGGPGNGGRPPKWVRYPEP